MATVVTNDGLAICAGALKNSSPAASPQYIGWAATDNTAAITDEYLEDGANAHVEVALDLSSTSGTRVTVTTSETTTTSQTDDTYRAIGTLTASGSGTVYQAGLFNNSTIRHATSSFIIGNFTGIPLVSSDSIEFTFTCQFTNT